MSMGEWKQMMDRKIQLAIGEKNVVEGIDLTANPSFTTIMIEYQRPLKFIPLTLDPYDGTKVSVNYV